MVERESKCQCENETLGQFFLLTYGFSISCLFLACVVASYYNNPGTPTEGVASMEQTLSGLRLILNLGCKVHCVG